MSERSNEPKGRRRVAPWLFGITLLGAGVGLLVVTDYSDRLDKNCEPKGWLTGAVMAVKKHQFWQNQLEHIDKDIDRLLAVVPSIVKANQEAQRVIDNARLDEIQERIYREKPHFRPTPAQQRASALREQAEEAEEAANLEALALRIDRQVGRAIECRNMVVSHLKSGS